MNRTKKQIDRIVHALSLAHRAQPEVALPEKWSQSFMRDLRRIDQDAGLQNAKLLPPLVFRKMILPFASATGFAAIALAIYVLAATQGIEQQLFAIVAGDPVGVYFMNLMGL